MTKLFNLKTSLIVAALLAAPVAQAATMGKADYKAAKDTIGTTYKADKKACDALSANAKDVCVQEAKGKEKVAKAELEYGYTGKASDQNKMLKAKAEATYAVSKEKCDDKSGNDKDVCIKEAKAVEVAALSNAKVGKKIDSALSTASDDKRNAEYKVAAEKCDAMSGDAKSGCVAKAKQQYGK